MTELEKTMLKHLSLSDSDVQPSDKTDKERIEELEAQNEMLTECLMELADIIYA